MYDNILVDGKNILCRAVLASRSQGFSTHPITIFLRMMNRWRREFQPKSWHVFWDVNKSKLWRKKLHKDYKEGRQSWDEATANMMAETQRICPLVLNCMSVTQYIKSENEADDLIYAFVIANNDCKNLIVSNDGDIVQITYHLGVDVHNPDPNNRKKLIVPKPHYDPVLIKSLAGDKSDNIPNYRLVKDKTAMKIIDKGLDEFLEFRGRDLFDRNRKLVDLSANEFLKDNVDYIKSVSPNVKFDMRQIADLAIKHNINGLYEDLVNLVRPFKNT